MVEQIDVDKLLDAMASDIRGQLGEQLQTHRIIGIRTGGVWIAEALNQRLGLDQDIGELNISFYRDDFTQIGLHPQVSASNLPFDVEGKNLILVDDVLMSGRTVRAAMNEIFDYGRPSSIELAVLIDLDQRELPIAPSFSGKRLALEAHQRVKLLGPESLRIEIESL